MGSKVTIGIIGTGFGRQVHVPAFRKSSACEIRTICASRLERAETAAKELSIPTAATDWRTVVNDQDIKAIALAVPPSLQPEIALAAAQAGKHLFCEKPLALNVEQARHIFAAAERSKVVHAMDFIFPEIPAWQKAHALLREGVVGNIRNVALTWRVETYAYRASINSWKTRAESGGGTLNNFASHTFYYLEWLLGSITKISGFLSPRSAKVEARVDSWMEFSQGFTASISIAADAFLGCGHKLEIYGDAGTLVLENLGKDYASGFKLFVGTRQDPKLTPVEIAGGSSSEDGRIYPVSRIAGRFIEAILKGGSVTPGLAEGVRTQVILDALRLAHQSGTWQDVRS